MEVEDFAKQHFENYKLTLIELVKNNTLTLINEDICSLFRQPPLDSMDQIKMKLFQLAKNNQVVLDTEIVNQLLVEYRQDLIEKIEMMGEERIDKFTKIIIQFSPVKEDDILKLPKTSFNSIDKNIKKMIKEEIKRCNQNLFQALSHSFKKNSEDTAKNKVIEAMKKYLTGNYQKDLLENIEFKMIIKDTTLMNSVLEQGQRYLFTKNNARVFDSNL